MYTNDVTALPCYGALEIVVFDDTTTCASSLRLSWEVSRLDSWEIVITGPVVVWLLSSGRDSRLRFGDHVAPADIGSARHITPRAYASMVT